MPKRRSCGVGKRSAMRLAASRTNAFHQSTNRPLLHSACRRDAHCTLPGSLPHTQPRQHRTACKRDEFPRARTDCGQARSSRGFAAAEQRPSGAYNGRGPARGRAVWAHTAVSQPVSSDHVCASSDRCPSESTNSDTPPDPARCHCARGSSFPMTVSWSDVTMTLCMVSETAACQPAGNSLAAIRPASTCDQESRRGHSDSHHRSAGV
jgi:hypothetical protein